MDEALPPPPWLQLSWIYDMDESPPSDYAYSEYKIRMKPPSWLHLSWIYDMDESPPPVYAYSEYMIWMKPHLPWLRLFWIYDMDEATPSPTCDCAYYEYMIGIKPPPDYAYSEYKGDAPPQSHTNNHPIKKQTKK